MSSSNDKKNVHEVVRVVHEAENGEWIPQQQQHHSQQAQQQQQQQQQPIPTPTSALHGMSLLNSLPSSAAHRAILNRLLEMPLGEFELALLQVTHQVVTHRCGRAEECLLGLRRLLCRLAAQSLHLGVKLLWTIEAFAPNADKSRSALEGLRELLEAAAVNGRSGDDADGGGASSSASAGHGHGHGAAGGSSDAIGASVSNSSFTSASERASEQHEEAVVHLKMGRASVLNDQRLFFQQLVGISDFLRRVQDRGARPQQLRQQLAQLSSSILQKKVFMPFAASSERPRWIVRILPDEAIVFSSRERAPFLFVVETVTSMPDADDVGGAGAADGSGGGGGGVIGGVGSAAGNAASAAVNAVVSAAQGGKDHHHRRGGGATLLRSGATSCADPDVREVDNLHAIGANNSNFHVYAKQPGNKSGDPFKESVAQRAERLRQYSPYAHLPGWQVESLVIKAGDDLTQEQLALQVVELTHNIWHAAGVPVYVLPYRALSVVFNGGIIECINDAMSIDSLKKAAGVQTLHQFFLKQYGEGTPAHAHAQRNFIESMAGYSVVCFLMQVRDRHNANLMLTRGGHVVHIDFGFMFGKSPGGINFESAPFKMSQELLDTMGGASGEGFRYFKVLLHLALGAIRDNADQLVQLVAGIAARSGMACFKTEADAERAVEGMRARLGLHLTCEVAVARYIRELVDGSLCNWRTKRYDQFQYLQNGII